MNILPKENFYKKTTMIPDNIPFKELDSIVADYIKENPANIDIITGLLKYISEYYENNDSVCILKGNELYEVMVSHFMEEFYSES